MAIGWTQSALWVLVPLSITFSEWQTILNNFRSKSCHFICFYLFNSALHSTILYIDIHVLLNIWRDCTPVIHIVVTLWRLESDSVLLCFFLLFPQNYIEQVENETIFDLEKRLVETKNRLVFLVRNEVCITCMHIDFYAL